MGSCHSSDATKIIRLVEKTAATKPIKIKIECKDSPKKEKINKNPKIKEDHENKYKSDSKFFAYSKAVSSMKKFKTESEDGVFINFDLIEQETSPGKNKSKTLFKKPKIGKHIQQHSLKNNENSPTNFFKLGTISEMKSMEEKSSSSVVKNSKNTKLNSLAKFEGNLLSPDFEKLNFPKKDQKIKKESLEIKDQRIDFEDDLWIEEESRDDIKVYVPSSIVLKPIEMEFSTTF